MNFKIALNEQFLSDLILSDNELLAVQKLGGCPVWTSSGTRQDMSVNAPYFSISERGATIYDLFRKGVCGTFKIGPRLIDGNVINLVPLDW